MGLAGEGRPRTRKLSRRISKRFDARSAHALVDRLPAGCGGDRPAIPFTFIWAGRQTKAGAAAILIDGQPRRDRVIVTQTGPRAADFTDVRSTNLGVVLSYVRGNAPCSRADIAVATGLNKATVSS